MTLAVQLRTCLYQHDQERRKHLSPDGTWQTNVYAYKSSEVDVVVCCYWCHCEVCAGSAL